MMTEAIVAVGHARGDPEEHDAEGRIKRHVGIAAATEPAANLGREVVFAHPAVVDDTAERSFVVARALPFQGGLLRVGQRRQRQARRRALDSSRVFLTSVRVVGTGFGSSANEVAEAQTKKAESRNRIGLVLFSEE